MRRLFFSAIKQLVMPQLLIALALPVYFSSTAQIPWENDSSQRHDLYAHRLCKSDFSKIPLEVKTDLSQAVIAYLKKNNVNLQPFESGITLVHDITSPGGRHLTYELSYDEIPVFQSQLKVNLDKHHVIGSIFDNTWNTAGWEKQKLKSEFENLDVEAITGYFQKERSLDAGSIKSRKVIAVLDEQPVALAEVEFLNVNTSEHLLLLVDNDLHIFLERELSVNSHANATATAMVFIPDPLTSAHVEYGLPYVDNDDSDSPALSAQRKQVDIPVTFDGSVYRLENQYVIISEFDQPYIPPVQSATPDFSFTRDEAGFEDANAFYHLTVFSQYVESLGFNSLLSTRLTVDAHGKQGRDQSEFSYPNGELRLSFGEGGVDDAEDADVIIHEFGHALSYSASPGSNGGSVERLSLDEGIGDYLAASYSRAIDTFRWADVFTWDGHNEYFVGRTAVTQKVYPDDLELNWNNPHRNAELYSSPLMKIWETIGKEKTDKLLLQSLYSLAESMSMKDAAATLFMADEALYNSGNHCAIYFAFLERGLADHNAVLEDTCVRVDKTITLKAGNDQTICKGDSAVLGDNSGSGNYYAYQWFPAEGLGSPDSPVTRAAPGSNTTYVLTASRLDRSYNTDSVQVNFLESCFLNTDGFRFGDEAIIKLPPNSHDNIIELFDINGKRLFRDDNLPDDDYHLSGKSLPAGVYILRVTSTRGKQRIRLIKISDR